MLHQRETLSWMLQRERRGSERFAHPSFRALATSDGVKYWVDVLRGKVSLHAPAEIPPARGGILGDDTGLGKTVTMIALLQASSALIGRSLPPVPVSSAIIKAVSRLYKVDEGLGAHPSLFAKPFCPTSWNRASLGGGGRRKWSSQWVWGQHQAVVREQSCLDFMMFRAIRGGYRSVGEFKADFDKMLANARLFYGRCADQGLKWMDWERHVGEMEEAWGAVIDRDLPRALRSTLMYATELTDSSDGGRDTGAGRAGTRGNSRAHFSSTAGQGGSLKNRRKLWRSNATLVVVPNDDMVFQWKQRVKQFAPSLHVLCYDHRSKLGALLATLFGDTVETTVVSSPTKRAAGSNGEGVNGGNYDNGEYEDNDSRIVLKRKRIFCGQTPSSFKRRKALFGGHLLGRDPKSMCVVVLCTLAFVSGVNEHTQALTDVFWRRVVVDESQLLGKTQKSNRLELLCELRSSFRWVLTGTPTADRSAQKAASDLTFLQQQLQFLQEPVWSLPHNFAVLRAAWQAQNPVGWMLVYDLFSRIMIRHSKADIAALRQKVETLVGFDLAKEQLYSYKALETMASRNLL